MAVLMKDKTTGKWTNVAGGGGTSDVSKAYVDQQDAAIKNDLGAAEQRLNASIANVQQSVFDQDKAMKSDIEAAYKAADKVTADKVTALETTVGSSTSGLVKDVATLKTTVGDNTTGLVKKVNDTATTVGSSTSGLVKDVNTLKTTVGDSTTGLVKKVNDTATTVGSSTSGLVKDVADLKTTVGSSTAGLVKDVAGLVKDVNLLKGKTSKTFNVSSESASIGNGIASGSLLSFSKTDGIEESTYYDVEIQLDAAFNSANMSGTNLIPCILESYDAELNHRIFSFNVGPSIGSRDDMYSYIKLTMPVHTSSGSTGPWYGRNGLDFRAAVNDSDKSKLKTLKISKLTFIKKAV